MIKIDIIGGGISGLTLGIALQKQGFSVQIFEQSPQLLPIGAGIIMASNAMQIAKKLDFSSEIRAQGNQAIEDAYFFAEILTNELKNATPQYKTDFSPILKRFEQKRRNKIKFVVDTSYQIVILSNIGGEIGYRFRNFLLRATPNRIAAQQFEKLFRLE